VGAIGVRSGAGSQDDVMSQAGVVALKQHSRSQNEIRRDESLADFFRMITKAR
jgi:hypothetical protein